MTVSLSMLAGAGAQFLDDNGDPLSGGLLYTYLAGTTSDATTFTTSAGHAGGDNANPIVLDAAGRVPYQIWLTDGVSYKFVVKTSGGVTVRTYDNMYGAQNGNLLGLLAADSGSSLIGFIQSGAGAVARTAQSKYRDIVSALDFGADPTGATDSTTAFQNAAIAVNGGIVSGAGPGGTVYVPAGTYKVSRVGLRDTILVGQSRGSTVIKCNTNAGSAIYFLDAATDRDGTTANTAGGGGFENLTIDGDNKTNVSGIRTYGGGVRIENCIVKNCRTGVALGLPIWATVKNVYSVSNAVDGFYTYSGAGDLATSTTFMDCWADSCGASGFYITQLTYSSFINCVAQNCTTTPWLVDGNTNGVSFTVGLQFIGCATEGVNGQQQMYFRKIRDLTIIGPRFFVNPNGYDLIMFDDVTGTIIDYGHSGSVSPQYMLGISNHAGGNKAICLIGGQVTFNPALEAYIATVGRSGTLGTTKDTTFLWDNATTVQQCYSQVAAVDGYTGLTLYANGGSRLAAFRRIGTPVFATNGAIGTPATYLNNGDVSFYVDTAASKLKFVCKDGSGNVKTGEIAIV